MLFIKCLICLNGIYVYLKLEFFIVFLKVNVDDFFVMLWNDFVICWD